MKNFISCLVLSFVFGVCLSAEPEGAVTVGNNSVIPVNEGESFSGKKALGLDVKVLNLLDQFEKAHPELKVTGWSVQGSYTNVFGGYATVRCIYVHHEPHEKK